MAFETEHRTVVLGASVVAPTERVYAALTDPLERQLLGAAGDIGVLLLDASDVRVGGEDVLRFGPRGDPCFEVSARYLDLVPGRRIVTSDVISHAARPIVVSMTTIEIAPGGTATRVRLTSQRLNLGGDLADTPAISPYEILMDCLARYLGMPDRRRR
jgi:uncharacterized protein YndB with AHSA1/START domain